MTSAYVTELGFKNVASTNQKTKELTKGNYSFSETMNFATQTQDRNTKKEPKSIEKKESPYVDDSKVEKNTNKPESIKEAENVEKTEPASSDYKDNEVTENLEEIAENIQNKIAETLGITSEEIMSLMDNLGLTMMDLLNPKELTQLMVELSGESDVMSLLTNEVMYGNVSELVEIIETMLGEMQDEFSLTKEQLDDIMKQYAKAMNQNENEIDPSSKENGKEIAQSTTLNQEVDPSLVKEAGLLDSTKEDSDKSTTLVEVTKEELVKSKPTLVDTTKGELDKSTTLIEATKGELDKSKPTKENPDSEQSKNQVQLDNLATQQGDSKEQSSTPQKNQESVEVLEPTANPLLQSVSEQIQSKLEAIMQESNPTAEQPNTEQIMKQVLDHMKLQMKGQVTEMELQLHPASLGTINLQVAFKDGALTAQLTAQNETVKTALESQMVQLKETLNEQGLKVESIEVTIESHEFERNLQQNDPNEGNQNQGKKQGRRRIVLDSEEGIEGLDLTEEEQMIAKLMVDNGNSVDFSA